MLKKRVPPKVLAAHYRAWMDGWTTSARMHNTGGTRACIWCGLREGDKLQHYCGCPVLQRWRTKRLAIPWASEIGERHTQFFNLLGPNKNDPIDTVVRGLALAASYHAYNACTHSPSPPSQEEAENALNQSLKEMVKGRGRLVKLVDAIWAIKKSRVRFSLKEKKAKTLIQRPRDIARSIFAGPSATDSRAKATQSTPDPDSRGKKDLQRKTKPRAKKNPPSTYSAGET